MNETCPYCNASVGINHDDGYGYSEGEIYEQECSKCGKTFCYTTQISYNHELFEAPCKNGEPHKLTEIHGYPKEFFEYKKRCEYQDIFHKFFDLLVLTFEFELVLNNSLLLYLLISL